MTAPRNRYRLPGLPDQPTMRRLAIDEDGAAYTLSYVMVIPVYALLICLMIDSVMMMSAKLGTVYSAFAAARTASVWASATTWGKTMEKAEQAARKSMTPFASGTHGGLQNSATEDALAYVGAYDVYAKKRLAHTYILTKYGYAQDHVQVEIKGPPEHWDSEITAKVTYEFPFAIPGIGRLLGKRGKDGRFYYQMTSTASVPNEGPQDDRKTIGIGYGTLE
jgi:hypothetical protein